MRNQEWLLEELRREHRCQSAPPACEAAALNVLPSSHAQHHANVYEVITLWRTCVTAVVTQQVVRALGLVRAAVCGAYKPAVYARAGHTNVFAAHRASIARSATSLKG